MLQDMNCVFVDAEHALDPAYARGLGVNLHDLHLAQPSTGEEALEICDLLVRRVCACGLPPHAELTWPRRRRSDLEVWMSWSWTL